MGNAWTTKAIYTNWMDDQPNNYGGNQDYIAVYKSQGWQWGDTDFPYFHTYSNTCYICELG